MSLLQAGFGSSGDDYTIDDSLRFRSSATAYLNRTPASAGNQKTHTFSSWVKRANPATTQSIFAAIQSNAANYWQLFFMSTGDVNLYTLPLVSGGLCFSTTQLFRDPSAWYHIVLQFDTTNSTAADRVKFYVNGERVTSFTTNNISSISLNANGYLNSAVEHNIGNRQPYSNVPYDGYLGEVNFIDGQALTADDFGEFDGNGTWKPLEYTGTYGTNGFYLPFRNRTEGTVSANYLVIAGGGGGNNAGGGGAGGYLTGSSLTLNTTTGYAVTVGAGGTSGVVGSDSAFVTITSDGGGNANGGNGGSGGGGSGSAGGTATSGQGNNGGNSSAAAWAGAGGGGGAGAVGGAGSVTGVSGTRVDGSGGAGLSSSITGSAVTRAGGGGGGSSTYGTAGAGGSGGGGAGTTGAGTTGGAGTANTGGGGGGGRSGGTGGSGVVIISYSGVQKFSGGTITASGSNTIHTFTTSGFLTTVFNDSSGNDNNWTGNNFNVSDSTATTYDLMKDTPSLVDTNAGNFAVLNPLKNYNNTLADGNLNISASSASTTTIVLATIGVSSGKWYWEYMQTSTTGANLCLSGLARDNVTMTATNSYVGLDSNGWGYYSNGWTYHNATANQTYGASYGNNDVIGVAFDADAGTLVFYKNGVSQGTAYTGLTSGPYFPAFGDGGTTTNIAQNVNFGQRPFKYTPPSGFLKLNTFNLPDSTIAKGDDYFTPVLYTGNNASGRNIPTGFPGGWTWIKNRNAANSHTLSDVVRGDGKTLFTNATNAEVDYGSNGIDLVSDGFDVTHSATNNLFNVTGRTYVAWNWRAGSTASNTVGSINSTVSANTTSGFSIVSYTGNNTSGATVGHGLGIAPSMVICKNRTAGNGSGAWPVWHSSLSSVTSYVFLNTTAAQASGNNNFTAAPTSTVLKLGTSDTNNTATMVAYCFAEVPGYSAFGSYTGNGSADGPFVYTGFRPAFVMFKRTDGSGMSWAIRDTTRDPYNASTLSVFADLNNAESSGNTHDILSNGFKLRSTSGNENLNGGTYIYMAFAENPFKNSNAR